MKSRHDDQNGVPISSDAAPPLARNERIENLVRFYASKFHLISIPISIVFSIIHLAFAIKYLGQCTIQPMINTYMIVHASVTLLLMLIAIVGVIVARLIYPRYGDEKKTVVGRILFTVIVLTFVLFLFSVAWLITGSVWVFGAKSNVQGSDSSNTATYCQSDLYRAAFVLIIINYIVHGIIVVIILKRVCGKMKQINSPVVTTNSMNYKAWFFVPFHSQNIRNSEYSFCCKRSQYNMRLHCSNLVMKFVSIQCTLDDSMISQPRLHDISWNDLKLLE